MLVPVQEEQLEDFVASILQKEHRKAIPVRLKIGIWDFCSAQRESFDFQTACWQHLEAFFIGLEFLYRHGAAGFFLSSFQILSGPKQKDLLFRLCER